MLERIRADGPLSSLDFERKRGETTDWFGMPTNTVRAVLEAFAVTGMLGLARREGNRRYYDLLERLLPPDLLARDLPLREQLRYKLLSRYRAHGLLGVAGAGDVFGGIGTAKPTPEYQHPGGTRCARSWSSSASSFPSRSRACAANASSSARTSRCWKPRPSRRPPSRSFPRSTALVWDRALLGSLFDFDYVWELFLPPEKRRWGWYVLPIIFRDRLVGRIEPRIDRADSRVEVLDVWWENGFAPRRAEGFVDAMRDALRAYLRFAGASRLEWAPHLGAEKRLFLTRP